MRTEEYYKAYVDLCLQLCGDKDYADKHNVRRHNAAFDKLSRLQAKLKGTDCEELLRQLLSHEDSRVLVSAAAFGLGEGILVSACMDSLRSVADRSNRSLISFSAEMVLKQYAFAPTETDAANPGT